MKVRETKGMIVAQYDWREKKIAHEKRRADFERFMFGGESR